MSLLLFVVLVAALSISPAAGQDLPEPGFRVREVTPDPDWDRAFDRSEGWSGADAVGSVALGGGRVLWTFGDTWIDRSTPQRRMVNNTIALQSQTTHQPPRPDDLRFFWGTADGDGHPTAWLVPHAVDNASGEDAQPSPTWCWSASGGALAQRENNPPRLVTFWYEVERNPEGQGIWAFRLVGTIMALIDNPDDPPEKWQVQQVRLPANLPQANEAAGPALRIYWGLAVHLESVPRNAVRDELFIYGLTEGQERGGQLVLARVAADDVADRAAWRYWAGDERWSDDPAAVAPLADNLVNEFSIEPLTIDDRKLFVLIQSDRLLGPGILLRTAPRAEGPWSKPLSVWRASDVDRHDSYFAYAAKGHAAVSRPGELLVSYVVNSHDFARAVNDTSIYRPRFVRLKLSAAN